jgi:hypothetical protein
VTSDDSESRVSSVAISDGPPFLCIKGGIGAVVVPLSSMWRCLEVSVGVVASKLSNLVHEEWVGGTFPLGAACRLG